MKIYLASPFFNPQQIAVVEKLENLLSTFPHIDVYSPRKDGVLINMKLEERAASTARIFNLNVDNMTDASIMVAVIDGRDTGVTWELGFFYAMKKFKRIESGPPPRIVTYTEENFGLNVMIKECVDAHCRGIKDLERLMVSISNRSPIYEEFRDFHPAVT